MCKIEIKKDMFDICRRLKNIDTTYFILYDKIRRKYELHSTAQKDTYCAIIPYDKLDKRTIDFVLNTRRENIKRLIFEMEENNRKLEQKEMDNILDRAKYDLSSKLKYYQNKV